MALDEALRKKREEICLAHMAAENAHQFDDAIGLFACPRYDLMATGEVYEGQSVLSGLMLENVTAFPDFRYDFDRIRARRGRRARETRPPGPER